MTKAVEEQIEENGVLLWDDGDDPNSVYVVGVQNDEKLGPWVSVGIDQHDEGAVAIFYSWRSLVSLIDAIWNAGEDAFGEYEGKGSVYVEG